jgi:hypothetical protein
MYDILVEKLVEVDEAAVSERPAVVAVVSPEKAMKKFYKKVLNTKLKPSTYGGEKDWYKYYVLTDGDVIPVKYSHENAALKAGVYFSDLHNSGAANGSYKANSNEMSINCTKQLRQAQIAKLKQLYIEFRPKNIVMDIGLDFASKQVSSVDEFEYFLLYGLDESVTEAVEVPKYLYHGTFKPLLDKIKSEGLKIEGTVKNYSDSEEGLVYLAKTPEEAEAFAAVSETVPDEWIDQIVVLKIDIDKLDKNKVEEDPNVRDTEVMTYQYSQDIPPEALEVIINEAATTPSEHKTKRLDITVDTRGDRLFLAGRLNVESKTWIDAGNEPVVEGTLDIDRKNNLVYLNRVTAWRRGKGYGPELLDFGIRYAMEKYGVAKARGYVERGNFSSSIMLKKMGFKEVDATKDGVYLEKFLKESIDESGPGILHAGWIHPNGEFEAIPKYTLGGHDKDAYKKLNPDKNNHGPEDDIEAYAEYLSQGHIRYMQTVRDFNIDFVKKPTESQMRAVRKGIKENESGEFHFDRHSGVTWGYALDRGSSWKEFVEVVQKMS